MWENRQECNSFRFNVLVTKCVRNLQESGNSQLHLLWLPTGFGVQVMGDAPE